MATMTATPAPDAPAPISGFGRVVGVFFSPKATFEDIVRKPTMLLPIVLITLLSILATVGFNQRVNWRDYIAQQIEKSPRAANLSAEQKQQQIEGGAKITPMIVYIAGALAPIIITLLTGLIVWGAFSLLGGISTNFGTALAITSHAFLTGLVSSTLLLLILYLKPYGTTDVDNPVAANLAAFLPEDSAKWLVALCKSFDVFTFWTLILLAIGFSAVNPKKLKGAKPYTIVFTVWAAFVVVRVGSAFIFS
jgi:hypothetical protein